MTRLAPFPFSLRQAQYAHAVAEHLSFRRAAQACHVSQPSLSAQLAELEHALGVTLFERGRSGVLVTSAGALMLPRLRSLLLHAEDLLGAAGQLADPYAGTLRLGVIPTISPYLLPAVTPILRALLPALRIAWVEDKTQQLMQMLGDGSLDGAVLAQEGTTQNLAQAVIGADPFVALLPPRHPLAMQPGPLSLKDLRGKALLLLDDGHCFRDQALAFCADAGVEELEFRATSLSTLVQMVQGGLGLTLLPSLAVPTELERARLTVRAFRAPAPQRNVALVWRQEFPGSAALKLVAQGLRQGFSQVLRRAGSMRKPRPRGRPTP